MAAVALVLAFGVSVPVWLWLLLGTDRNDAGRPQRGRYRYARSTPLCPRAIRCRAPALSLDRLRIDCGAERSLMISPRDRTTFMRELEAWRALHRVRLGTDGDRRGARPSAGVTSAMPLAASGRT
ncbi:PH domain-containing protein [Dokdonella soli]|uniref:PH domain-containing protein n=1 Tax=Dokdonella soli TaxID=529810 RepID=UPI003624369D